jgi:acyl-CoA thioester hydrolase
MITIPVYRRFSDLDPLGHVNNVVFHDYLQEARVGLIGDLDGVLGPGYSQVVVSQEIRHHRPLPYSRDPVQIEVWMASSARASYTLAYRILDDDGSLAAEATTVIAVVDPDTGRPIRIPEHIKDRLPAPLR